MISTIASIQPKWCEQIASGKKTIEVRKTAPKEVPFKVFMYCTNTGRPLVWWDRFDGGSFVPVLKLKNRYSRKEAEKIWDVVNGKVIGEFVCYKNERFGCSSHDHKILAQQRKSCMTMDEIIDYCNGKDLYGWHISDLKIYDKPKELSEFGLKRPPQSWMYCEEVNE